MRDIEDVIARLSENTHRAGVFSPGILRSLAGLLPDGPLKTLETGCGNSTILFSNIAASHLVFAYDDRNMPGSSVDMVTASPDFRPDAATFVLGPTQATLPRYDFSPDETFDVILLDGPHGYPFPDLEYALLYPRLHAGSILIVDDIHIPSIGNMYDLLRADRMYDEVGVFASTGVLRRTADPGVPADGDHWYEQNYNISQFPRSMEKYGKARPVGSPGIVHFDSPSAVDTYGGRGVEMAPGGGAARTIDSTATFLFQLSPCDARQQRVAITYRTIHAAVVMTAGMEAICSYDRGFDRIMGLVRSDPPA